MSLINCKQCGALLLKKKSDYCDSCQQLHNQVYLQVRRFLMANQGSTLMDVHRQLDIPIATLQLVLSEGYTPLN